jgi:tetratricopeptide (TPR) repeat protein
MAMRLIGITGLLALGLSTPMSIARTDTAPGCPDSGMPIEPLGSDKEQHEALYQQARACVREGKPLRAVALLTQIIKYDPTSAIAYLNRGSAQASAGEVALAIGDFSVAKTQWREFLSEVLAEREGFEPTVRFAKTSKEER